MDVDGNVGAPRAIAVEHIEGETLRAFAAGDPAGARSALADILAGLEHLHERGLVHGDLKPAHLLVDKRGRGRLIDLGLACPIGSFARGGTLPFVPPEALLGAAASVAGDLYSLGRALGELTPLLDARSSAVLSACADADPSRRPASALACISALGETRRRLLVSGGFPRCGDKGALDAAVAAASGNAGEAILVEAAAGSGRRRFIRDLRARTIAGGRSTVLVEPERDPGWASRIAGALSLGPSGDNARDAEAAICALRARGVTVVVLADDDATAPLLTAATRNGDGLPAVIVCGNAAKAAARLSGAVSMCLPTATRADVLALFEHAFARIDDALADRILVLADCRLGMIASLARRSATAPLRDEGELLAEIRLLDSGDDSWAGKQASESPLDLARRGAFREALIEIARLGARASETDRLLALQCHERLGELSVAADLATHLAGAREPAIALAAQAVAAHVALSLGDGRAADALATSGLALASSVEPTEVGLGLATNTTELVGRLHNVRSDAALRGGDVKRALTFAEAAAAHARGCKSDWLLAQALARSAAAHALGGDPRRALGDHAAALAHAERTGDVGVLPPFIMNLATAEHALGQIDRAVEHYQEAAALSERLGRQSNRLAALTNLAGLWIFLGATMEAGSLIEDAEALAMKTGDAVYRAQLCLLRAELSRDRDVVLALELSKNARDAFLAAGAERQALEAELFATELAAGIGQHERALLFVASERERLHEAGLRGRSSLLAARAHNALSRHAEAARYAIDAHEAALAAGDNELAARASYEQGCAQEGGQPGAGAGCFERGRRELEAAATSMSASVRARFLAAPERARVQAGAPPAAPAVESKLGKDAHRLLALVRRLLQEGEQSKVLEATVDEAVALTGAERALLLLSEKRNSLRVAVARNVDKQALRGEKFRFSRSVAERVIQTGEAIITASAPDDPALGQARSIMDLGLRSIMCVPIRGPERTLGALYLDHRIERGRFAEGERELTLALADIAGIALEKARLLGEAQQRAEDLARDNVVIALESERRALEVERLARELSDGARRAPDQGGIVGRSHKLRAALDIARRVAPSDLPVLIRGESGTGKELFARFVHAESARASGPFVAINCGAVPESLLESELFGHKRGAFTGATADHAGLFRQADGGTLLLDEIGEMPLRMQTRLLRVLQEREVRPVGGSSDIKVDVRIVAATHRNLEDATVAGTFREDLYYRLLGARVMLPALRDRKEDVLDIAFAILKKLGERYKKPFQLTRAAETALLRHDWPGNVRELEQTLTRGALLSEGANIDADALDLQRPVVSRKAAVADFDRGLLEKALASAKQNRSAAAKALGISRVTLHRWMKRYDVG